MVFVKSAVSEENRVDFVNAAVSASGATWLSGRQASIGVKREVMSGPKISDFESKKRS